MKTLIPEQQAFIDKTIVSRARCVDMAELAHKLNLPLLAREWDFLGKCLERAIAAQARGRDASPQDLEPSATVSGTVTPAGPQTKQPNQQKLEGLE